MIPINFADLIVMAREHVSALRYGNSAWGFGKELNWAVDLDLGTVEWALADGLVARAPAELLGTWASDIGSYRWAWDHPAVGPELAPAAKIVREFALKNNITELQRVEFETSREDALDFASVAVLHGDLQGLHVGQASSTAVAYIGFGEVTVNRQ